MHNKGTFCNGTIIFILPHQNIKSGYFIKNEHSQQCIQLDNNIDIGEKNQKSKDKDNFIQKCEEIMNCSSIFDRNLFKNKFKEIYNSDKYSFPLSNNILSNIITKWRNTSVRFTKANVLLNQYDYKNRLIFREFRSINVETTSKKKPILLEYIIWGNDENISRLRLSKNYFIDGTFHHPPEFKQLLIIMYRDIISSQNIPGIYIVINGKFEEFYDILFDSLIRIITQNHKYDLNVETIVTDTELALINVIKKYFPNSRRIGCFFHYKQDLLRNIKIYGLYKKKDKIKSNEIINILSKLPILYNGNMQYIQDILNTICEKYEKYNNFINNYFKIYKIPYFIDQSLNYNNIPQYCRTNNFLENYNGYIKMQLGKSRIINWVNFINFIKLESERTIEKLLNNSNINKSFFNKDKMNKNINFNDKEKTAMDGKQNNILNLNYNIIPKDYIKTDILEEIPNIINSLIGFNNIGNSCYANSIMQLLLHSEIFLNNLENNIGEIKEQYKSISYSIHLILLDIIDASTKGVKYIDIFSFLYLFGLGHKSYSGYIQHDAQEFLRILLNDISSEMNQNKKNRNYTEIIYTNLKDKIQSEKEFEKFSNSKEKSFITELFNSVILTKHLCKCNEETYSFNNIIEYPLTIPKNINLIELSELLDIYFQEEIVEFVNRCQRCKNIEYHKKELFITKLPKILIISLQRLNFRENTKNECIINFSEKLDLSKYIDNDFKNNQTAEYNLLGFINHIGTLNFGHYYSYIKLENKTIWYKFDDSKVNRIGDKVEDMDEAYILFYTRKVV